MAGLATYTMPAFTAAVSGTVELVPMGAIHSGVHTVGVPAQSFWPDASKA